MISERDKKYMDMAVKVATYSGDLSRRIGCTLVGKNGMVLACGTNNIPVLVKNKKERLVPPLKYSFTTHAEISALARASRRGYEIYGSTMYILWFPCATCALALVEFGVKELVCIEPDWEEERYDFKTSRTILKESEVKIRYVDYEHDTRVNKKSISGETSCC